MHSLLVAIIFTLAAGLVFWVFDNDGYGFWIGSSIALGALLIGYIVERHLG